MAEKTVQSVEPNIADLANGWLKSYGLDYKLEQESLNSEIDQALNDYYSKSGGKGGNRPDVKLLLQDKNLNQWPVLIEYKGHKGKLVKLDGNGNVSNRTAKNEPDFRAINSYAVNGAVHYANAILQHTNYTDIIAIGMTGYRNNLDEIQYDIGVYYISKNNFGIGQKIDEYTDFSFLRKENFDEFISKVNLLHLTQDEIEKLKEQREQEIEISIRNLNNDIYKNEDNLEESDRLYLVAASIIATLGIPGKVAPLEKSELKSSAETENQDGDIILRKIKAFLSEKDLPTQKRELIVRTLQNTLTTDAINKPVNGESQLKRVFSKIVDDLGLYYKIGLTTDFTGKLFNEMYNWLGFSQDRLNDVVLTPSYVATLLVKLARIDKDSYVWDFATGSAGLLVAAMNEMLADARNKIKSPDELAKKSKEIKTKQLLGIEILPSIYMLSVLNMILMGDGSSNIINTDSLKEFDGNYSTDKNEKFPANAFVLNPPYSAAGNGMIFVERALSMMKSGYAAIIIQNSAGSGKAKEFNKNILKHSILLASIKMPNDLFLGKSSVQTSIYVFQVGKAHQKDDIVKFIDFSIDGYTRTNRKKASKNLKDTDHAKERYQELVDIVRFGKSKLHIYTEKEYYEGTIDPESGEDWNQVAPIDTRPTMNDFKRTVRDHLDWEIKKQLEKQIKERVYLLEKINASLDEKFRNVEWSKYRLGDLFEIESTMSFNTDKLVEGEEYDYVTRTSLNQGVLQTTGFVNEENINEAGNWSLGLLQMDFFYRRNPWYAGQFVRKITPKIKITKNSILYFTALLNKQREVLKSVLIRNVDDTFRESIVNLPVTCGEIDYNYIDAFIEEISVMRLIESGVDQYLEQSAYMKICGLDNYVLSKEEVMENYKKLRWRILKKHHS